jgi:predicted phosphohydrolase
MRIVATADLHLNHPRSRPSAEAIARSINAQGGDVLLVIGDVGVADGDSIETCLGLFDFRGPRLFVPGNHELWTNRTGVDLLGKELPRRVTDAGWHWLPGNPFDFEGLRVVGTIGWYDYSFAEPSLEIPDEFYRAKMSPASVAYRGEPAEMLEHAQEAAKRQPLIARWNDGRFVRLGMSDETVVDREIERIEREIVDAGERQVIVACHTVPFAELMPPRRGGQWDFARAYLGARRLGQAITRHGRVSHVMCGHSHWPMRATIGSIDAINIGSGYREKRFVQVEC